MLTFDQEPQGLRLLNLLRWTGVSVAHVLVCTDVRGRRIRWLRHIRRRLGWTGALAYAAWRARSRWRRSGVHWRGQRLEREYPRLASRIDHALTPRDPQAVSVLERARPSLCLLGDCGLVPPALLAVPGMTTLNAHPGVLPDYRGLDPALWAVLEGRFDRVGCTLHIVDAGIDTGPILDVRRYAWRGDETIDRLEERLENECVSLLAGACHAAWPEARARAVRQGSGRLYSMLPMTRWPTVARKLRGHARRLGRGESPG